MPLFVRWRPNAFYLLFMLIAAADIAYGVTAAFPFGPVMVVGGGVVLALLGYPVVVSTVCRVPVVDSDGIRFPLSGARLRWTEVSSVRRSTDLRKRAQRPVLLIFPVEPTVILGQVRPWLRPQARSDTARYGTPIVISDASLDHSIDDITAAIHQHRPTPSAAG